MNNLTRNQDREDCYHMNQKGSRSSLSLERMEEKAESLLSFEPNSHGHEGFEHIDRGANACQNMIGIGLRLFDLDLEHEPKSRLGLSLSLNLRTSN